ncbi:MULTISPECIES: hypothetical protein [Delftia]|nr:hypothetical protein [Delftia acidovorans]
MFLQGRPTFLAHWLSQVEHSFYLITDKAIRCGTRTGVSRS